VNEAAGDVVVPEVREMQGAAALPRQNGELVFDAPWQGRVLGLALALVGALDMEWDEFRSRLIAAIAADPARPYYESWTAALETLVADFGIASSADVTERAEADYDGSAATGAEGGAHQRA
jgi:nitrile hydratase accessory protein